MFQNHAGEYLRQVRLEHGYTSIKDFVEKANISYQTYYPLEKGIKNAHRSTLRKLADFYKLPSDKFCDKFAKLKQLDRSEYPLFVMPDSFDDCTVEQLRHFYINAQTTKNLLELYLKESNRSAGSMPKEYVKRLETIYQTLLQA